MIPRVRVNYGWRELLAAFASRAGTERRDLRATLAALCGVGDVLLTPSGRAGLHAILQAVPHRRVLVPAYTCKAVVEAALLAGKEVAYVDAAPESFNSGAEALADRLDSDTVFVATHQFGIPCAIAEIAQLCRERGALLVEDCAASLGTRVGGKLTGTFGDAAFFSFDSTKLIHVPLKAGFVIARTPELLARIRAGYEAGIEAMPRAHQWRLFFLGLAYVLLAHPGLYRLYHTAALRRRYTAETRVLERTRTAFYRYDVTEWQAAIARPQLARLDAIVARRRALFAAYRNALAGCRRLALPPDDARGEWACIRFPIRVPGDKLAWYRAANARGVDFAFSFTHLVCPPEQARAHALGRAVLDLPYYDRLTPAELQHTAQTLRALDAAA